MNIKLRGRKVISFLLAVQLLAVAATPALAWEDMGGPDFQSEPCDIATQDHPGQSRTPHRAKAEGDALQFGTPEYPWALARAEGW